MTKKKSNAGRKPKLTKEVLNKLEDAFSLGCSDREATLHAGISGTALYNYQKKNPQFVERKEALKQRQVLKAKANIAKAIDREDYQTSRWYLERKCPDEFGTRLKHEGNPDKPLQISIKSYEETDVDEDNPSE